MKTTLVKKGEKASPLSMYPVACDEYHVRGSKAECEDYARTHGLTVRLHRVTGDAAPLDEWYGIATKA